MTLKQFTFRRFTLVYRLVIRVNLQDKKACVNEPIMVVISRQIPSVIDWTD